MAKKFKALGVYIFAGGFTVGVKKHFDVDTHFEHGPYGTETALTNKVVKQVHIDPATWPDYKADFVYGNPPCAPWSLASAGRDTHWTEDPRTNAVRRLYGLIDRTECDVWAWESVRPTFVKGRALIDTLVADANKKGFHATALMVDGAYHGVAQQRPRMFIVLSRFELPWTKGDRTEAATVREAWKGLSKKPRTFTPVAPVDEPFMKTLKPGERAQAAFDRLNPGKKVSGEVCKGRPGFLKYRLHMDETSRVLLGGAHLFHPSEKRYISVEESAAICGYPRGFTFKGGLSKQYAQVAQAVMPPVGEYLARIVRRGLQQRKKIRKPGFQRVEILGDRIEVEDLQVRPTWKEALTLVPETPVKPPRVAKDGKPRSTQSRGQGVGAFIRECLTAGDGTDRVLLKVRKKFPQSKATAADVSWNRRKLAGKE